MPDVLLENKERWSLSATAPMLCDVVDDAGTRACRVGASFPARSDNATHSARRGFTRALLAWRAAMHCCNRSHRAPACSLRRQPWPCLRATVRAPGLKWSNADAGLLRELDSAAGDGS